MSRNTLDMIFRVHISGVTVVPLQVNRAETMVVGMTEQKKKKKCTISMSFKLITKGSD